MISDYTAEENYLRTLMLQNAKQSVFLCDSEKFDAFALYTLTNLKNVDYVVFDAEYKQLRAKCNLL